MAVACGLEMAVPNGAPNGAIERTNSGLFYMRTRLIFPPRLMVSGRTVAWRGSSRLNAVELTAW
jgi:hypothetical protein